MRHISILLPVGDTSLSNLEATYKMFNMANSQLEKNGGNEPFQVQLVGMNPGAHESNRIFRIVPDVTIKDLHNTSLIIIPAIHGNYEEVVNANKAFVPWIIQQYKQGAEIASLCIGAFLLASTGLLDGKNCATHWLAADTFRTMFPEVNLVTDKIITDENGIYTSGGAYSSLNLNLYLIEKLVGREMAVRHAKIFEIDIERNSQSPFIIFQGQKSHTDQEIREAQEYMEIHYPENITVNALCERYHLGRRTFERRFKKATSNTVVEYLQRVRVEAAKKQLEAMRKNIQEIMFEVGYNDPAAFREVFRKCAGLTPIAYREKFKKPMQEA